METAQPSLKARATNLTSARHKYSAVIVAVVMFASFMAVLLAYSGPMASRAYHAPIVIDDNGDFATLGFPGEGTESEPYLIENLDIYGSGYAGIEVVGTTAHFDVRNVHINSTEDSITSAIYLENVSNATIESCPFNNTVYGIEIYDSDNVTIWDITVANCSGESLLWFEVCENLSVTDSSFLGQPDQWYWFYGYGVSGMCVSGNEVNGTDGGAYFDTLSNVTIESNTFESCNYPIVLLASEYCGVSNNTMSGGTGYGIQLDSVSMCLIRGNWVSGFESPGVYSTSCHDMLYSSNTVSNCSAPAFYLTYTTDCVIYNNTMADNDDLWAGWAGGVLMETCERVTVYHNCFYRNTPEQAYEDEPCSGVWWNATYPTGGNFWDDCGGIDELTGPLQDTSGSDGIADDEYSISVGTRDFYPLMEPPEEPTTPIPEFTSVVVPVLAVMVLFLLVRRVRSA